MTTASFRTSTLAVGSHTITASYGGDSNFLASTGTLTQTVGAASTSTGVVSGDNPSASGQSVDFTATVSVQSPGAGSPTGTVQFTIDGSNAGSRASVSTSGGVTTASFRTATLAVGTHTVTASYRDDGNFASSSGTLKQPVNKASTKTALTSVTPSVSGQMVTLTATVGISGSGTAAAAKPTGAGVFSEGGTSAGQRPRTTSSGTTTASLSTSNLAVGSDPITASYGGDSNFLASTDMLIQGVNKAETRALLLVSASTVASGQPIALTATV